MKKLSLALIFVFIIIAATACQYTGIDKLLYSYCEKYEIKDIGFHEYEVEIDGRIYKTMKDQAASWKPIAEKEAIIGVAKYNGLALINKTSSPSCYKLENADMFQLDAQKTPHCLIYDISVDYSLENAEISSYSYVDYDNESSNMYCNELENTKKILQARGEILPESIRINESERNYLFDLAGHLNFYSDDKRFEGLVCERAANVYKRLDHEGGYYLIYRDDDKLFGNEITELIKE